MTLLDRVHQLLSEQQVQHALLGAAALAVRGIARSTYDVDLLTTDARVLDESLWRTLSAGGVAIEIRRGDADDPLGGIVRLEERGARPVDVVVGKLGWQTEIVERAEPLLVGGPLVVTAADLILLKLYAGGSQDLWDVRELLSMPGAEALRSQIDSTLIRHSVEMRERWRSATS